MAKKQKSTKKRGSGGTPQPMAALYRLDAGTPRGDAVRTVLAEQGIRAKTVTVDRLGDPVGAIAGLVGFRPARVPYAGDVPENEFMLLCNVSHAQVNQLLPAMREADCSVGCKAQLTQHNRLWPFVTLVQEVSREHASMTSDQG
jgi:hypothetical protein